MEIRLRSISPELTLLLILMVPVVAVMILHYILTGFVVYNDGRGYYINLRSIVIDKDVDFLNEWTYFNNTYSKFSDAKRIGAVPELKTPKGYIMNIYLIGNGIMWAPFFLTAHAAALLLNSAGLPVMADGFGPLYEASIGVANLIYGFLGIWLIYKFCRKWFERKIALIATIGMWYGTAAFWYHAVEPSMAHMNSLLLVVAFTYLWYNTLGNRTKLQWFLLGLLLGLIYLVRQQEVLLGLLPGFEILKGLVKRISFDNVKKAAIGGALLMIGTLVAISPQMLVWKEMYGEYVVNTYARTPEVVKYYPDYATFSTPQLLPFLFSREAGMWRMPFLFLSLIGLFMFAFRVKGVAWYFLVAVLAQVLLTSAWAYWTNGYGLRFLLGMSVFFTLGAAELIKRLRSRFGERVTYAAVALLIAVNFVNMILVMLTEITSRIPLSEVLRLLIGKVF